MSAANSKIKGTLLIDSCGLYIEGTGVLDPGLSGIVSSISKSAHRISKLVLKEEEPRNISVHSEFGNGHLDIMKGEDFTLGTYLNK